MFTHHHRSIFYVLLSVSVPFLVIGGLWLSGYLTIDHITTLYTGLQERTLIFALVFVCIYTVALLVLFSNTALVILAGALFGPILGALVALVGGTIAALVAYLIAHTWGEQWLERWLKGHAAHMYQYEEKIEGSGFLIALLLRMTPLLPKGVLNYLLGLTRIRLRDMLLGTFLGMIPGTILLAVVGDSLMTLSVEQGAIALLGYALFLVLVLLTKRHFDRTL